MTTKKIELNFVKLNNSRKIDYIQEEIGVIIVMFCFMNADDLELLISIFFVLIFLLNIYITNLK